MYSCYLLYLCDHLQFSVLLIRCFPRSNCTSSILQHPNGCGRIKYNNNKARGDILPL